jgi:hypothetical protein
VEIGATGSDQVIFRRQLEQLLVLFVVVGRVVNLQAHQSGLRATPATGRAARLNRRPLPPDEPEPGRRRRRRSAGWHPGREYGSFPRRRRPLGAETVEGLREIADRSSADQSPGDMGPAHLAVFPGLQIIVSNINAQFVEFVVRFPDCAGGGPVAVRPEPG